LSLPPGRRPKRWTRRPRRWPRPLLALFAVAFLESPALAVPPLTFQYGTESRANFGAIVANAGDLDGDGINDLAVASPRATGILADEGVVRVWRGASTNALTANPVWTRASGFPDSGFGERIASAGDVDGDGFGDLLIAAPRLSRGEIEEGRVWLFYGGPGGIDATRSPWFQDGEQVGAHFGTSLAAGDFNNDGYADFAIGAPDAASFDGPGAGFVALYLGSPSGPESATWRTFRGAPSTHLGAHLGAAWDLDADGPDDLAVASAECVSILRGNPAVPTLGAPICHLPIVPKSLTGVGDIDNDGRTDLVALSPTFDTLRFYPRGDLGASPIDLALPTQRAFDQASIAATGAISAAGDLNADGYADLVVGLRIDTRGGALTLFGGPAGPRFDAAEFPEIDCECDSAATGFGDSVTGLGDFDGDGFADLAFGMPTNATGGPERGAVALWRGHAAGPSRTPAWTTELDGDTAEPPLLFIAPAGDVNGDGRADLLLGAPRSGPSDRPLAGTVLLYSGTASGLDRDPAWTRHGGEADDRAGVAVAPGDIDGDGLADIAIGEPGYDVGAAPNAGRIVIALGTLETPLEDQRFVVSGLASNHGLGAHLAGIGDFDGDGLGDLVACELQPRYPTPLPRFLAGGRDALREFNFAMLHKRCTPEPTLPPSIASAGDFDDDGLADVAYIFREPNYPHLSIIGTSLDAWMQYNAKRWGRALGTYGDVDGNGVDDLFLATPSDATGLGRLHSFRAPWGNPQDMVPSTEAGDGLGEAAAGIGDLDGDGFADYLVGAPFRSVDGANAGSAWIYRGSPTGIFKPPAHLVATGLPGEKVGRQVGAAGDLNGDGFPDFMVARIIREGRWRIDLYLGNGGLGVPAANGLSTHVRSPRTGRPVAYGGLLDTAQSMTVRGLGASAFGAMPVVLEAEAHRFDRESAPGASSRSAVRSASQARAGISTLIDGLEAQTAYHVRARLRAPLGRAPLQIATRWVSPSMPHKPSKVHVRTRLNATPVALPEEYSTLQTVGFQTSTGTISKDSVLANDFDPDSDPLTATILDPPGHGDLTLLPNGHFNYRPETSFWGTDTFTYRAADGLGGQAEAMVAIHVHPIAPCEGASESRCRDGDYFLVVETTQGMASVHCWIERAPDRVVCDTDDGGALRLGPPLCE